MRKAGRSGDDRISRPRGAVEGDRSASQTGGLGEEIRQGPEDREAEVGAASGSSVARGGAAADGQERLEAGRGHAAAVVGLALRFALTARPTGSQICAPAKPHEKNRNKNTRKKTKTRTTKKGTLLMR